MFIFAPEDIDNIAISGQQQTFRKAILVQTLRDLELTESNENFFVNLSNPTQVSDPTKQIILKKAQAEGTIQNVDQLPDLVATSLNVTLADNTSITSFDKGQAITISGILENQGDGTALNQPYCEIYLSQDDVFDPTEDIKIASQWAIEAETNNYTFNQENILIPLTVEAGYYYPILVVDPNKQELETNEEVTQQGIQKNNIFIPDQTIQITQPTDPNEQDISDEAIAKQLREQNEYLLPDLAVTSASAIAASSGGPISVSWTVTNQGEKESGEWIGYIYSSADNKLDPDPSDTRIIEIRTDEQGQNLPSLSPDGTYILTRDITIPAEVTDNSYLIFAAYLKQQIEAVPSPKNTLTTQSQSQEVIEISGDFNAVIEPNLYNNFQAVPLTVVVNHPPAVNQAIAFWSAIAGQPFSFTIPVTTFTDIDGDALSYSLAENTVLPDGITFEGGTFSGTPTVAGTYHLTVIASDPAGASIGDTFTLKVLNPVNGTANSETVTGTSGDDYINAGAGNDTANGGEGNDVLDGGTGSDRLYGGEGNDTYIVDNSRDVVVESGGQGKDTVQSSVNHNLTAYIEDLILTGTANISGTGNDLDNTIRGNSGNNLLKGLGGNDILLGEAGNDTLVGGSGNDILTGGDGEDQFLFGSGAAFATSAFGVDTLADLIRGSDKIALSKTSFNALSSAVNTNLQAGEFAAIDTTLGNEVTLAGSSSARIVYNLSTGNLFYNQNGATDGLGDGAPLATLTGTPSLDASDFLVLA
jgi:Ca2+-binding RTX toxin-like protein